MIDIPENMLITLKVSDLMQILDGYTIKDARIEHDPDQNQLHVTMDSIDWVEFTRDSSLLDSFPAAYQDPVFDLPKDVDDLAAIQHEIWSHWMKYFYKHNLTDFSAKDNGEYYQMIIDKKDYHRWEKQMNTSYADLSEDDKEKDREIVRKFMFKVKDHE